MFFFRRNAEPAEEAREHEEASEHEQADPATPPANEVTREAPEADPQPEVHQEGEEDEEAEATRRENTVPPPEEIEEDEEAVQGTAEPETAAAPPPPPTPVTPVPGIALPRTETPHQQSHVQRSATANAYTPRRGSASAYSQSRPGGRSADSGSVSPAEAEALEQHYRRCSSVVRSARHLSDRRASSVNGLLGDLDGGRGAQQRRSSAAMSPAEREAVEQMLENELHRQEAMERSAQYTMIRETMIVESELQRERAGYDRQLQLEAERNASIEERMQQRYERAAAAAQRRQALEAQRQQAVLESVRGKEARYTQRDPYSVVVAQRRYSSPAAPSRRASSPYAEDKNSRRASGGAAPSGGQRANGETPRRHSAPFATPRGSTSSGARFGIDMSRPQQCLPMSAWKTPAQLQRGKPAGVAPHRCLPPGAWQENTIAEHPRQWH